MRNKLSKVFLVAFILRLIFAFVVWHPDVNNHVDWGIRFWDYGPKNVYTANVWSFTWPNQPPGTMYLFAGIHKLYKFVFSILWWINIKIPPFPSNLISLFSERGYQALLQMPAILADIGIAYLIFKLFDKRKKQKVGVFAATIFLFNPVVLYNSSVWGQTDALINFFGLLAFILLLEKRLLLAVFSFFVSLYIKASLLIFAPLFVLIVLRQRYKMVEIIKAVFVPLAILGMITLPFSTGEPYSWLFSIYKDKVFFQQLHVITANAFNIWAGLTGIHEQPHTLLLGSISYQLWGIILYTLSYIPSFYLIFKKQDFKSVFWALSMVSFSTFMLLTNMHERYLYPLFPVFTIVVAFERRLPPLYWLVSGLSLANLYNFWWTPKINGLVNLFSIKDRLAPRILGFVNFGFFAYLYRRFLRLLPFSKI